MISRSLPRPSAHNSDPNRTVVFFREFVKVHYATLLERSIARFNKRHRPQIVPAADFRFRSIFENAQIGIGIFNVKTGQHVSNRAQTEQLGYSQEELSHLEQWDKIVHPDDSAAGAERYGELLAGKRDTDEYGHRYIRPDGSIEFMQRSVDGGTTTFIAGRSTTKP